MVGITDSNRKWWILVAMGAALGLMVLDETIVGVALPTIQRDLNLSHTQAHWVVNAYLVVFAALAAAMGKLGDMVGLKRFFLLALVVFGVTSLAAGFAQDETTIILARALQGVGAAVILPGSMAMMMTVFPPAQRGLALGVYGAVGSIFMSSGPLLGGAFTEYLSWRWIFWVNPFLVVAIGLVVLATWHDPPRQARDGRFDLAGLVALVAGVGLLVLGLMQGHDWGWTSAAVMGSIAIGIVSLVVFVLVELRHRAPLIEVDLFANRTLAAGNLIIFTGQFSKTTIFILVALYLQHVLGISALGAGVALLWAVLPVPVMAILTGRITDRFGERMPALLGFAINILGFLWLAIVADGSGYWILVPSLLASGIATCFFFVPPMRAVANALPDEKQGQAGGIMLTSQLLGGAMGMTILSVVLVTTRDYHAVFGVTFAVNVAVGLLTWAWFVRNGRHRGERA